MSKAYFYKILITEKVQDKKGNVRDVSDKSVKLKSIINPRLIENKKLKLSDDNKWVVLDLINLLDKNYQITDSVKESAVLFAKLNSKLKSNTSKRNQKTNERSDIVLDPKEHLEAGTYLAIFFDYNIIVYLTAFGAPHINNATGIFQPMIGKEIKILPVIAKDAMRRWKDKDITSRLEIETTLASDEILRNVLNLSEKEFDSIRNGLTATVELVISTGRSKTGIFVDKPFNIAERIKGIKKKAVVKARDDDEKTSTEFDLLEERFIRKAEVSLSPPVDPVRVINEILKIYGDNIKDVLRYIRE